MDAAVECTHCGVTMTSWSAPGSPIRYWQCPFCSRTHSSLYGEVFRRRAGARVVGAPVRTADPAQLPMATPEDIRWAEVKLRAARWFARLQAEEHPIPRAVRPAPRPDADLDDDVEIEVELEPSVRVAAVARRAR